MIVTVHGQQRSAIAADLDLYLACEWLYWHLLRRGQPVPAGLSEFLDDLDQLRLAANGKTAAAPQADPAPSVPMRTTTEHAAATGIPERTVRHWCATGRIPGARRHGRSWHIPTTPAKDTP